MFPAICWNSASALFVAWNLIRYHLAVLRPLERDRENWLIPSLAVRHHASFSRACSHPVATTSASRSPWGWWFAPLKPELAAWYNFCSCKFDMMRSPDSLIMATASLFMTRGNPALEALPVVMICLLCITIHDYLVFDRFYSNMVKYSFISMFDVLLYLLESSWSIQIHDMIYLVISNT